MSFRVNRTNPVDKTFGLSELFVAMNDLSPIPLSPSVDGEPLTVKGLRAELGLTLAQMGELVGLSKSQMHEVEAKNAASLPVAIRIEELSGGRIDAAGLSDDVRLARHGIRNNPEGVQDHVG